MTSGASILGYSWVTPFGHDVETSWESVRSGATPPIVRVKESEKPLWKIPVSDKTGAAWFRHPRLRRSSAISLYAIQAGSDALQRSGYTQEQLAGKKLGLIFAISSGGVVYTRRFYQQIAEEGANNASPLLFPETVYNAPASHLANLLNVNGVTYTLVGDGTIGISAIQWAQTLLATGELDLALVVASEEVDWVLCEAYAVWRYLSREPRLEVGAETPRGTILAEGAGAVLLGAAADSGLSIHAHRGVSFYRRKEAGEAVAQVVAALTAKTKPDAIVSSANGTFIDCAEYRATAGLNTALHTPKASLGEAIGAGALQQIVYAAELMKRENRSSILALSTGFNQQATGANLLLH